MIRRYRRTGWDLFASVLLLICVAVASWVLLLEANGYLIDFSRLRIEPSSLLVLRATPREIVSVLDGTTLDLRWDATWQIPPGRHDLVITAPERLAWRQSFHVAPRQAAVYRTIILYWAVPKKIEEKIVQTDELKPSALIDSSLRVLGGELWALDGLQTRLVTRFSRPVLGARFLDDDHLIVQLDNELHAIDIDGTNDRIVLRLPDPNPRVLNIENGGRTLDVVDGEKVASYELY